jgi:nicotinamide-nucleotide amidase
LGGSRRVIRRRRINCFGAGESQLESMLPDLIRRGRRPTVGITASKATISLRIAADGKTEEECYAAMKPTVDTIRQCLGTLVFGEEDDQLQDAVVRLLRQRGKTLATTECGTAGLVTEWLASVESAADVYRGGVVLPRRADESVGAMAIRCREQFGTDFGLAIGPVRPGLSETPASLVGSGAGDVSVPPETVALALASADVVQGKSIPLGIHPALHRLYLAKQALNFVRLILLA